MFIDVKILIKKDNDIILRVWYNGKIFNPLIYLQQEGLEDKVSNIDIYIVKI